MHGKYGTTIEFWVPPYIRSSTEICLGLWLATQESRVSSLRMSETEVDTREIDTKYTSSVECQQYGIHLDYQTIISVQDI